MRAPSHTAARATREIPAVDLAVNGAARVLARGPPATKQRTGASSWIGSDIRVR